MTMTAELTRANASGSALALQDTLTELIELALQGKHAHWNVVGPLFKPVHEGLDELVDAYREWYDDVAERMAAIGAAPDGRTATIAAATSLEALPAGPIDDRAVVAAFASRIQVVAGRIRARADSMADDLASQDLLIEILRGLDKQAWMLRAQLA
jgi:starvation-inducible DNA-binding protein